MRAASRCRPGEPGIARRGVAPSRRKASRRHLPIWMQALDGHHHEAGASPHGRERHEGVPAGAVCGAFRGASTVRDAPLPHAGTRKGVTSIPPSTQLPVPAPWLGLVRALLTREGFAPARANFSTLPLPQRRAKLQETSGAAAASDGPAAPIRGGPFAPPRVRSDLSTTAPSTHTASATDLYR